MARTKRSAPRFGVYRPGAEDAFHVPGAQRESAGDRVVVATWNIHFCAGATDDDARRFPREHIIEVLDQLVERIQDNRIDVLAIQEVDRDSLRSAHVDQFEYLREHTGLRHGAFATTWDASWVPYPPDKPLRQQYGRMWSGQAILSRFPILEQSRHGLAQPKRFGRVYNRFYIHRCIQQVAVDLGQGRSLTVLNAHLEPFDKANRRAQARALSRLMRNVKGMGVTLGDFNAPPPEAKQLSGFVDEPDMDFYGDDTLATLRASGWRELGDAALTFPASSPTRRLDHAFVSPSTQAEGGHLLPEDAPASDHRAVVLELTC